MSEQQERLKVSVKCVVAELRSGATVRVGFVPDRADDDSYYFGFKSSEGFETRVRLSAAAFEVIIGLKAKVDLMRNVETEVKWRVVSHDDLPADTATPGEPEFIPVN